VPLPADGAFFRDLEIPEIFADFECTSRAARMPDSAKKLHSMADSERTMAKLGSPMHVPSRTGDGTQSNPQSGLNPARRNVPVSEREESKVGERERERGDNLDIGRSRAEKSATMGSPFLSLSFSLSLSLSLSLSFSLLPLAILCVRKGVGG